MKGTPNLPPLSALPSEQIEQIESFIEKHGLEISLGKQKTAKFLFTIYGQEELKRKKKEKYSRKLLKDAEKLILSMQISPLRRSHIEPGGAAPKRKKDFSRRKAMESERIQSETKEERIRRRLKKFIAQEEETEEKLVKALMKREDGVELAEKFSHLFLDIWLILNSPEHSAELPSGDAPGDIYDSRLASLCGELGRMAEEMGVAGLAGEAYRLQADSLKEKEPGEASGIYLKAAELLFQDDELGSAARAFENLFSILPQEREKTLDSLHSRLSDSEKAGDYKEAAKLSHVLADIFEKDAGKYSELKEREAGNWLKCGELRDAASTYARLAHFLQNGLAYRLQGAPSDEAGELTETLNPQISGFYEKSANAYEEHAKSRKPEDSKYFFAQAAENYSKAAYSSSSGESEETLFLKAAENYQRAGKHSDAAHSFVKAGDLLLRKNPAKAAESYEKAMKTYIDAGEYEKSYQQHFNLQQALGRGDAFDAPCNEISSLMASRAKAHEKEGMHFEAGNAYHYAAELTRATFEMEPSPKKVKNAFEFHMKSAESYERGEKFKDAGFAYSQAAHLMEKRNPGEAIRLYEKSAESYLLADSTLSAPIGELRKAANLAAKTNPERAAEFLERCAAMESGHRNYENALDAYSEAIRLNPALEEKTHSPRMACAILSGKWKQFENEIRERHPSMHALLQEMDEQWIPYLRSSGTGSSLEKLEFAINTFLEVKNEVGFMPARLREDLSFLAEGLAEMEKGGFGEIKGIPPWFLPQAYAASGGDTAKLSAIRKISESKDFRNSKDKRKEISWFLADNSGDGAKMEDLSVLAELSSSKKLFQNISSLRMLYAFEPSFGMKGIGSQEDFNSRFEKAVDIFIGKRTESPEVAKHFRQKLKSMSESGFLIAITTLYHQYSRYSGLDNLLDIALITTAMGDFEKAKFPTKERIESMYYLSRGQKELLLNASTQLSFLSPKQRSKWGERDDLTKVPSGAEATIELARNDLAQKIKDLKFHFREHINPREGELEKQFAFTPDFLEKLNAEAASLEARGEQKSPQYIKLKNMERIIVSVSELETVDPLHAREKTPELKSLLRGLGQSTASLFKNSYKMKPEEIESLQAKMDIELLSRMLIEEKEKLKISKLSAYDSADSTHLILAGKQPDNCGSCQRYDGTPSLMVGLSGYLMNAHTKIIRVENQDGVVVGRSMLRAVTADGEPALFLERAYYRNSASNPEVEKAIVALAKKKADSLGVPLLSTWMDSGNQKQSRIIVEPGLSKYEYSDGLGGGAHGNVSEGGRDITITASVL